MFGSVTSELTVSSRLFFYHFQMVSKREKLIEKLGVHIEHKERVAPLAARIIASLILRGKKGATFDNLVCELQASKSAISTNLTTLQAMDRIIYYTKPGDRKKYYLLNPNSWINTTNEMIANWNTERDLHLEISDYKKEINKNLPDDSDEKFDLDFHTDYLKYLDQAISLMQKLQSKLIVNQTND